MHACDSVTNIHDSVMHSCVSVTLTSCIWRSDDHGMKLHSGVETLSVTATVIPEVLVAPKIRAKRKALAMQTTDMPSAATAGHAVTSARDPAGAGATIGGSYAGMPRPTAVSVTGDEGVGKVQVLSFITQQCVCILIWSCIL